MKKALLLTLAASAALTGFAQRSGISAHGGTTMNLPAANHEHYYAKGTGDGDTLQLSNILATDSLFFYSYDTGYVYGMNKYGDKGFAERFDFNGADSSLKVVGAISLFTGTVSPTSNKTINVKVWSQGAVTAGTTHVFYTGKPNTTLATQSVMLTALNLDSTTLTVFATPTNYLNDSFFVGYDVTYNPTSLNGDTIGLYSNKDGQRTSAAYTLSGADTIVNVKNAVQWNDNLWYDNYFENSGNKQNLAIFPIVIVQWASGVNSVSRNDLTFFGNYPNPATNNTNIKFALKKGADVSIQIMDITGKTVKSINENNVAAGEHTIAVETSSFAAGTYVYLVRTSNGDGIASQLTIVK